MNIRKYEISGFNFYDQNAAAVVTKFYSKFEKNTLKYRDNSNSPGQALHFSQYYLPLMKSVPLHSQHHRIYDLLTWKSSNIFLIELHFPHSSTFLRAVDLISRYLGKLSRIQGTVFYRFSMLDFLLRHDKNINIQL